MIIILLGLYGKYTGIAGRVALVLHHLEHAFFNTLPPLEISKATMGRAIYIVKYCLDQRLLLEFGKLPADEVPHNPTNVNTPTNFVISPEEQERFIAIQKIFSFAGPRVSFLYLVIVCF